MSEKNKYQNLVRENIRNLKPYSSARHEFTGVANIQLDANENPFQYHGYNRYPDPLQNKLKERISEMKGISADSIFLGNGSDEAIDILTRIFCTPGRDAIHVPVPTYGMYRVSADINDVEVNTSRLGENFELDSDVVLSHKKDNDHILWLCNPNNPTGNIHNPREILQLLENFPGIVVVDEAYIDYSSEPSMISLIPEHPNLVVLQTFSKAWGLAGMRIGMAFAQPWIIHYMNAVKPPYNINSYTQAYVLKQLDDAENIRREVSVILQEREKLAQFLNALEGVQKVYPSESNFILFKIENSQYIFEKLREEGIVIRNRNHEPGCENCLRVTIGTPEENEILKKHLKNLTT